MTKLGKEAAFETQKHILLVAKYLGTVIRQLLLRIESHDSLKLISPELEGFAEHTKNLENMTYGSDEYNKELAKMDLIIRHHYAGSSHHPENKGHIVCNKCSISYPIDYMECCEKCGGIKFTIIPDISKMSLIDLIECVADWCASVKRHKDGDIWKSLEINKKRFNIDNQLFGILSNTIAELTSNLTGDK